MKEGRKSDTQKGRESRKRSKEGEYEEREEGRKVKKGGKEREEYATLPYLLPAFYLKQ